MADEREAWREAFCVLAKGESLLLFIILHTDFSILQYIITTCLVHLLGYEVRQFFLDFIATTVCWSWCLVTRIPGYSVWQQKTRV